MYTISPTFYNNVSFWMYVTIFNLYEVLRSRSPQFGGGGGVIFVIVIYARAVKTP